MVVFDLETLPNLPEALKVWPSLSAYPGITLRASITSIACGAWKVLGTETVHCVHAWDFPTWDTDVNDDRGVCETLYGVIEQADCVITHNGKRFDWKFLQTRLRFHDLPPLPPIHHVDTCQEAKKHLFVLNNRLNTVARFLTEKEKMEHEGWDLWVSVHGRKPDAMQRMSAYCKQDVVVLEEVFQSLKPLIKTLPNYNLFSPMRAKSCPVCGSTRLSSNGKRHTSTRSYFRYICQDCKHWTHTDVKDEVPR